MRTLLAPIDSTLIANALLVIFFLLFIGLVVSVYSRRNRPRYDRAAKLPLHDEG